MSIHFDKGICKYIFSHIHDGTARQCDRPYMPEKPYCEEHYKLCYTGKKVKDLVKSNIKIVLPKWRPAKATEAMMKQRARG